MASEREKLELQAEQGDADAALRLARYYAFAKSNPDEELKWLSRSAELGNATAQYNLAYILIYDEEHKNLDEAAKWLDRAAAGASATSDDRLKTSISELQEELQ
jgi:TPR repeat protein